jgi:hypothetical protein
MEALADADFRYRYPRGNKLKPGSEMHDLIRDEVMQRAQLARDEMSRRWDAWRKLDEQLTNYIPLSEYDKDFKGDSLQDSDPNKPISIVVPVSQAVLDTMLSYLVTAFLDEPILKYEGVGPEDELGAAVMEHVIQVNSRKAKLGASLHTLFRDGMVYGIGAAQPVWTTRLGHRRVARVDGFMSQVAGFFRTGAERDREEYIKFEGNVLHNIDPYSMFPDVSVSPHDLQRGEYFGFIRGENVMELLGRERTDPQYFNAKYVQILEDARSHLGGDESERDRYNVWTDGKEAARHRADTIYMAINIIPAAWGVGNREYPEWWLFGVTGDSVVILAQPLDYDHGMLPFVSFAPTFDGYSPSPISALENVYGMQHLVNYLYNIHIANQRKSVNNMFVVDPEMINLNDLKNPGPGKHIRLRKRAWGRGVQNAVEQLRVDDITRANIQDAAFVQQMMQNFSGATDALQGVQRRSSERVSATEFRGVQLAALNRIERIARMAGIQLFQDLGEQFASNTQQFMSEETWVALKGRHEQRLREILGVSDDVNKVMASPEDLLVAYDVLINDGSLPNSGDPQIWGQMFANISQNEALLQEFDVVRIFEHWARLSGAKNVDQFRRRQLNAQVISDEEAMRERERGNIVPLEGGEGGGRAPRNIGDVTA